MVRTKHCLGIFLVLTLTVLIAVARQASQHHNHKQDSRAEGINERGDHAMGFSHEKTTHHFRLTTDGGIIEVAANDPKDSASIKQIRMHLSHIASLFKKGDFSKPMFTHGETPAGVDVMQQSKENINYTFEIMPNGGRVRIATQEQHAIEAIHDFLRYQIKDHKTGDSLEVSKEVSGETER